MADTMEDKGRDASRIDSLWMLYISYGLVFAIGITDVGELLHLPVISRWFIRKRGTAIGIAMAGRPMGPCTGEQVALEPEVAVVRCRDLRRFRAYFEHDFFANLHRPRLRVTRLGNVSRARARNRHKPRCSGFTMKRGYGSSALQGCAVGINSRACQQQDMTARHPPDVEPPIVRLGDVQAESVVVRIGTADQDLPTTGQGIMEQSSVVVWVSIVRSHDGL
jgi:hypothetical protein